MTGAACTRRNTGMTECGRLPRRRPMAYVTALRRRDMISRFACRGGAVMARRARTGCYARVTERCRFPRCCTVTCVAGLGSNNMGRRFT
jgi:hypothetical protein